MFFQRLITKLLHKVNMPLRVTKNWDDGEARPKGNLANSAEKETK